MGTRNFYAPAMGGGYRPSNMNLEARAGNSGHYAGMEAGNAAKRDIAAAMAMYKAHVLKGTKKSVPSDTKGPKV